MAKEAQLERNVREFILSKTAEPVYLELREGLIVIRHLSRYGSSILSTFWSKVLQHPNNYPALRYPYRKLYDTKGLWKVVLQVEDVTITVFTKTGTLAIKGAFVLQWFVDRFQDIMDAYDSPIQMSRSLKKPYRASRTYQQEEVSQGSLFPRDFHHRQSDRRIETASLSGNNDNRVLTPNVAAKIELLCDWGFSDAGKADSLSNLNDDTKFQNRNDYDRSLTDPNITDNFVDLRTDQQDTVEKQDPAEMVKFNEDEAEKLDPLSIEEEILFKMETRNEQQMEPFVSETGTPVETETENTSEIQASNPVNTEVETPVETETERLSGTETDTVNPTGTSNNVKTEPEVADLLGIDENPQLPGAPTTTATVAGVSSNSQTMFDLIDDEGFAADDTDDTCNEAVLIRQQLAELDEKLKTLDLDLWVGKALDAELDHLSPGCVREGCTYIYKLWRSLLHRFMSAENCKVYIASPNMDKPRLLDICHALLRNRLTACVDAVFVQRHCDSAQLISDLKRSAIREFPTREQVLLEYKLYSSFVYPLQKFHYSILAGIKDGLAEVMVTSADFHGRHFENHTLDMVTYAKMWENEFRLRYLCPLTK